MTNVAIIGGTGVYDPKFLTAVEELSISTPYGDATVQRGMFAEQGVVFLPRHGKDHSLPPHRINYLANICALKELGVKRIIATAAVGSLRDDLKPGQLALVGQFLDFTKGRPVTFFDGERGQPVVHTDFTTPYCPQINNLLKESWPGDIPLSENTTYVCTEGPRFETPAEIKMYRQLGGDLVGMTGVPEVVLARELGLCYSTIAIVTNFGAGLTAKSLTHQEVSDCMAANIVIVRNLIKKTIPLLASEPTCRCSGN